jgi:DNA-directed RNA polymerase subunit M/transcription elongation factor TFIIS
MMPKKLAFAKKKAAMMEDSEESGALECPKCGAELADTPKNRAYIASKSEDSEEMDDEEYED